MKKLFILILLLLSFSTLLSQDWIPYQLNQSHYYKMKDYYKVNYAIDSTKFNDRIVQFCFDSVSIIDENSSTYYSQNYRLSKNFEKCNSQILNALLYFNYEQKISIDSFLIKKDTIYLSDDYYNGYFIKIPLNISLNDSCVQSEYTLTYAEKKYQEILPSLFDSVKVFKVKYKIHKQELFWIVLSKNNGLIINNIWDDIGIGGNNKYKREYLELIGITKDQVNSGLVPKEFNIDNFFQQKVGDLKYWIMFNSGLYEDTYVYFKDSIIAISDNENTINIRYKRFESRGGKYSSYNWAESFFKDNITHLINNPYLNYYKLGLPVKKNLPEYYCDILFKNGNFVNSTSGLFEKNEWGYPLLLADYIYNSDSCKFDGMVSEQEIWYLFPKVGLAFFQGFGDFGQGLTTLEAYTLDGKLYGSIPEVFNSVNDNETNNLLLFPNPTSDKLTLSQIPDGTVSYEIFDIFGERVLSVETIHELSLQIDVSSLQTGVYFLKLNNQPPVKFIKL